MKRELVMLLVKNKLGAKNTYHFRDSELLEAKVRDDHLHPAWASGDGLKVLQCSRRDECRGASESKYSCRWGHPFQVTGVDGR